MDIPNVMVEILISPEMEVLNLFGGRVRRWTS